MPKFVTIGYDDEDGYSHTSASAKANAHAYDAQLQKSGVLLGQGDAPFKSPTPTTRELRQHVVPTCRARCH
jgi:hypothetical protein